MREVGPSRDGPLHQHTRRQATVFPSRVGRPQICHRGAQARFSAGSVIAVFVRSLPARLTVVGLLVLAGPVWSAPAPAHADVRPAPVWSAPLAGALSVTRGFDPPAERFGAGHRGVDLAGRRGEPVLAAGNGVVLFAGTVAGRPVVSLLHGDGLRTTYEPVAPSAHAGQTVARGDVLGTLRAGHAGCPAEACLHWGVRRGEVYLDPLLLLRPPRVRLLPWADG